MSTTRGRSIAILVLASAGLTALVALVAPEAFGGAELAWAQALLTFGVGAFVYRGETWAVRTFVAAAFGFAALAAWRWADGSASAQGSVNAPLVACVVWMNAALTPLASADLKAFLQQQNAARDERRAARQHARAAWAAWLDPFDGAAPRLGGAFVATVAAYWVLSWYVGGGSDSIIPGAEGAFPHLPGSAVMLALLLVATIASARGSAYGPAFLFASSAWFTLSITLGVLRAAAPPPWVPRLERALPAGFTFLVLFGIACLFWTIRLGSGPLRSEWTAANSDRRIQLGAGAALGLLCALVLGRPALQACRTERPGGAGGAAYLEQLLNPRLCAGFCVGRRCDYEACKAALRRPCEELSGRTCIPERECRTVTY